MVDEEEAGVGQEEDEWIIIYIEALIPFSVENLGSMSTILTGLQQEAGPYSKNERGGE